MERARCCRRQVKQKQPTIADWAQSLGQVFEKAKRGALARLEKLAHKATSEAKRGSGRRRIIRQAAINVKIKIERARTKEMQDENEWKAAALSGVAERRMR